ncbi:MULTISPECIES: DUF4870 domain-containing protein [Staphylococcus]|uniref:DUF4870 domain-containing protein n=1 Tax=Staphylococcus xylosus TaxID=1288 RepID=A0A418IRX3_STAXY|nr:MULTISPECIES: DUF4870 domain-containing protein [Staphylococcus]MBF0812188.1 DUF4870 domain-containing protein [Staphylococcus saprophyticus]MDW8542814.1 DUF4870 domain-containing protein [Staphylococcus sp. KG4-1]MRF38287.1 DUF4870 domain-containing protein [Staphylococcus sp. KY49P]MDW8562224.1 DUF4870 domain-containing protein [Staphylococcus sp. KG4-3]NQD99243.1 DUF4870 domain-containing protein [Staphylococcus xylosus]
MTTHLDEQVSNTYGNQEPDADARLMATLIYVLSFFTSLIAPLIIWLIKRDESPFVDRAGKNYLNFLLSYLIWITVATIAIFIIIGIIILPILVLLNFIFTIVAAVKAYNGEDYLPPLSIRFFK